MTSGRIAIKIIPSPAAVDSTSSSIERLARITKLTPERIREKLSVGKSIVIVTEHHPRLEELVNLIRSMGFSVITNPVEAMETPSARTAPRRKMKILETEWKIGDVVENLYEVKDVKQGGMGAVYIVRHRRWNTMMAVKSLLKKLRANEEDRALFVKEAETWIEIGFHPNVAACYYVRSIQDSPRIFIEYVDGGGLNEWLSRRKKISWELLLDLMVQVADGLQHAHRKGLVHRDVKPANCMMTKEGILKVTDFGLTKRKSADSTIEIPADPSKMTGKDSVTAAGMGTPGYMAPEMWIPHAEVGPQADIYAFGIMFFEICCGRKPFVIQPGEKRDKLALAHVKQAPPSLSIFRKDIPHEIEELILRCLRKHPQDRYQSFSRIRKEIEQIYQHLFKRKYTREEPDEVKLIADALNNRAVSLMDLNHEQEAESVLLEALKLDPHHPEAVYNAGLIRMMRSGSPDQDLLIRLEEVAKAKEYVGRGSYLLSTCLLAFGDSKGAANAAAIALNTADAAESWLKVYGTALIGQGKKAEAIEPLRLYLDHFPVDDEARGRLVCALIHNGQKKEAESVISALPTDSELRNRTLNEIAHDFDFTDSSEKRVLNGHSGWITSLEASPYNDELVSAGRDRNLIIWDSVSGDKLKVVNVIGEAPGRVQLSPEGNLALLVGTGASSPLKVLDLNSGKYLQTPAGQETSLSAFKFTPDGKYIVTVHQNGSIRLWDRSFKSPQITKIQAHKQAEIFFMDGKIGVVFSGLDKLLKVVFPITAPPTLFEKFHQELITILRSDHVGSRFLTCGRDKTSAVWEMTSPLPTAILNNLNEIPLEAVLNPRLPLVALWDPKTGIKLWDYKAGSIIRQFDPETEVQSMTFSRDGDYLWIGGKDMALQSRPVYGKPVSPTMMLAKIRPITKQMKSDRQYNSMLEEAKRGLKSGNYNIAYAMLRESQKLTGYERSDSTLDVIYLLKEHGERVGLREGWKKSAIIGQSGILDVQFSPSAIYFLSAHADHMVRLWSTKAGKCIRTLEGHSNVVSSVKISANGREAISGSDDKSVRIWDLNTGRNTNTLKGHSMSVGTVLYSPCGKLIVSGSWDTTIRIWNNSDGSLIRTIKGHDDKITSIDFADEKHYIISAGNDASVKMWDISNGRLLRDLRGHKDKVLCVRTAPGREIFASASADGVIKIWNTRTGACLKTLECSPSGLKTMVFSPDGKFICAGGVDAIVRIWNLASESCEREFKGHSRDVSAVDFSPNSRFVLSASVDGSILLWELDWELRLFD